VNTKSILGGRRLKDNWNAADELVDAVKAYLK
jgi:hypothetical protein